MRFGMCPCCTETGGLYDFYNIGANFFNDETVDYYYGLVRRPSYVPAIYNYYPDSTRPTIQYFPDAGWATSAYEGWYVNTWTGGRLATDTDFDVPKITAISMNNSDKEYVWIFPREIYSGGTLDTLEHSGINYTGGRTIGPDAKIENNRLILTSDSGTSGAYIRWDFSSRFPYRSFIDIEEGYDKFLLFTVITSGGTAKHETWFKITDDVTNTFLPYGLSGSIWYTGGVVVDAGIFPVGTAGKYKNNTDSTGYIYRLQLWDQLLQVNDYTIDSFEIRMVDEPLSYTINDISGFGIGVPNLKLSTYFSPRVLNASGNVHAVLIDAEHQNIVGDIHLTGDNYFSIQANYDGPLFSPVSYFREGNRSPILALNSNITSLARIEIPKSPTACVGYSIDADFEICFSESGQDFSMTHFGYGGWIAQMANQQYNTSSHLAVASNPQQYISKVIKTYGLNETSVVNSVSNLLFRLSQEDALEEKKRFYQNYIWGSVGSGHLVNYSPVNIDNYNNKNNFPLIQQFDYRNKDKCFFVWHSPVHNIVGTGTPIQTLEQSAKIYYGSYKVVDYTLYGISGRYFINNTSGWTFDSTFTYSTGGGSSLTATVYSHDFPVLHGDIDDCELLWEDFKTYNVLYDNKYYTYTGSKVCGSPDVQNITTNLLYGSVHKPTNKKGISFVYSYNTGVTGECYAKINIGGNTVYTKEIKNKSFLQQSYQNFIMGPYALHKTEDEQRDNMSGNYAAFVWFEQIYNQEHTYPSQSGFASDYFLQQGDTKTVKIHVCNETGLDLWTRTITYVNENDMFDNQLSMRFIDSSDRFFYINMRYPYDGLDNVGLNLTRCYQQGAFNTGLQPKYAILHGTDYSGQLLSVGLSHDGTATLPVVSEYPEDYYVPAQSIGTDYYTYKRYSQATLKGYSIKNSTLLPLAPKRSDWITTKPFPPNIYTITGFNELFQDTATLCPYLSLDFETGTRMWVSTTGFNLADYTISGISAYYVGINNGITGGISTPPLTGNQYLRTYGYDMSTGLNYIPVHIASGILSSGLTGWL